MAENAEKMFKHFLEFTPNLRTAIIDEMAHDDRCRFTRCSKMCSQEAKASKNYIYGIQMYCLHDGVVVTLKFDKAGTHKCCFIYGQRSAIKIKVQMSHNRTLWRVDFDESIDLIQYVNEEVQRLFQSHRNSIRRLYLLNSSLKTLDLKIEILKNLEEMDLIGDNDVQKILSKLQKPLKKLSIEGVDDNSLFIDCKQIYEVQHSIRWFNHQLNNQQFLRISASKIYISIGQLTEKDVFDFIRSWQNGTIGKEIDFCLWDWKGSNFNKETFASLLRVPEFRLNRENGEIQIDLEIKHFKNPGKSAILCFREELLMFDTLSQEI